MFATLKNWQNLVFGLSGPELQDGINGGKTSINRYWPISNFLQILLLFDKVMHLDDLFQAVLGQMSGFSSTPKLSF